MAGNLTGFLGQLLPLCYERFRVKFLSGPCRCLRRARAVLAVFAATCVLVGTSALAINPAQAAVCPAVNPPEITFDFIPKSPQLDRNRSVKWLNHKGASHNSGWFVTGLTRYAMQAKFEMRIEPVALGDGSYCLLPALIHPTVTVSEHLVYIASELPRGSCEYNVVYAHEGQHVAINQHMELDIRNALPKFLDAVTSDFSQMQPLSPRLAASRIRNLLSKYGRDFKLLLAKIDRNRQLDHGKIDTAAEYDRLSHACGPNSAFQTTLPAAMRK